MRIFVDLHHAGLYRSLQLLFEKRLGYELYRPIGESWFTQGYWKIAEIYSNAPETIGQYLAIRDAIPTKMGMRNTILEERPDYYLIKDEQGSLDEKAITYEQFMANPPDVVIASYFGNLECYKKLADSVGAKLVAQYGNWWPTRWDLYNNLLASVAPVKVPDGKQAVFYHQEFDQDTYHYEDPQQSNLIRSFVHCLPEHDIYKQDWLDFQELEKQLPEFTFESYGISCREGTVIRQDDLANKMRASRFGLHFKHGGDGFGHTIHSFFSVGRPVIYKGSQYAGKLAGDLLEDGKTGFDYEKGSVVERIRSQSGEEYQQMCRNVRERFDQVVNFEEEAKQVKLFMENLI